MGATTPDGFGPECQMSWTDRAVLQGVTTPDKLKFPEDTMEKFRRQLVANMVPPPFARKLAEAVVADLHVQPGHPVHLVTETLWPVLLENLPPGLSAKELKEAASPFGEVVSITFPKVAAKI